jgi:hypothetical protein
VRTLRRIGFLRLGLTHTGGSEAPSRCILLSSPPSPRYLGLSRFHRSDTRQCFRADTSHAGSSIHRPELHWSSELLPPRTSKVQPALGVWRRIRRIWVECVGLRRSGCRTSQVPPDPITQVPGPPQVSGGSEPDRLEDRSFGFWRGASRNGSNPRLCISLDLWRRGL